MTIDKYRRVIWRLEELGKSKVKLKELRLAMMKEIGTDERTIKNNLAKMIELKYIKRLGMWDFRLLVGRDEI
jgi:hypothetical protein|tara:strand:- start:553 stop:768 length:216 start_codon:yes stop_codon:yes gene_type:complete